MHTLVTSDATAHLQSMESESVHCIVTSPPYFGLRNYGHEGQIGLEKSADEYISKIVDAFREMRRVLRADGVAWLNLGDTYGGGKQLLGMPWRVAISLQSDGWFLRQDIIWHKPSPMPESVNDRCTKAHEYVFLLTKSPTYFYDAVAISEPSGGETTVTRNRRSVWRIASRPYSGAHFATMPPELAETCIKAGTSEHGCCSNCGSPWTRVTKRTKITRPRPSDYVKRTGQPGTGNSCANSVAGVAVETLGWQRSCQCDPSDPVPCVVLDPFAGSGTTLAVAKSLGRDSIGIEINPDYVALAEQRIAEVGGSRSKPRRRLAAAEQGRLF